MKSPSAPALSSIRWALQTDFNFGKALAVSFFLFSILFFLSPSRHDLVGVGLTLRTRLGLVVLFLLVGAEANAEFSGQASDEIFGEDDVAEEHHDEQVAHRDLVEPPILLEHQDLPLLVVDAEQGEDEGVVEVTEAELVG